MFVLPGKMDKPYNMVYIAGKPADRLVLVKHHRADKTCDKTT